MKKRSRKKSGTLVKVLVALGVIGAAGLGYILYQRSKQPGMSDLGRVVYSRRRRRIPGVR